MKSAKKSLAVLLAVMHVLTYSTPVYTQDVDAAVDPSSGAENIFLPAVEFTAPAPLPEIVPAEENSFVSAEPSPEIVLADPAAIADTQTPVDTAPVVETPKPITINLLENTTTYGGDVLIGSAEWYVIQVVNALGDLCESCGAIWNLDSFTNLGQMDVFGKLAIIAPVIVNEGHITTTGDLILSNLGIDEQAFFAGMAQLEKITGVNPADAYILNTGEIESLNKKIIALIGGNGGVHNLGTIASDGGVVAMIVGDKVAFPVTRDGLINISSTNVSSLKGQVLDKDGKVIETNGLVTNSGLLQANGGAVVLQASGSEQAMDSIINLDPASVIQAQSIGLENGKVVLRSDTGHIAMNDAVIDVSGLDTRETGGTVDISNQANVIMDGKTVIDASGDIGGGDVNVRAHNIGIGSDVIVKADAVTNGDGGNIVLYTDNIANIFGTLTARGGAEGGNGGFIETSGEEYLNVNGISVDASAVNGEAGTWLLDPRNIEIVAGGAGSNVNNSGVAAFTPTGGGSQIGVNQINNQLNGGTNVTIATGNTGSPGAQVGNILVSAAIDKSLGSNTATLTLTAFNNIVINAVMGATAGILNIILNAGANNSNASVTINSAINTTGNLTVNADTNNNDANLVDLNTDLTAKEITIRNANTVDLAGDVDLRTTNGDLTVRNNIGGIILSGGSGTINILSTEFGAIDLDNITTSNAAADSPDLTVTSAQDINIDSVDIKNGALNMNVDSNNNGGNSATFGALTAGVINLNGAGGNDSVIFNGVVETNNGSTLTITNVNDVTFNSIVTTANNLEITNATGVVDFAGSGASTVNGAINSSSAIIRDSGTGSLSVIGTSTLAASGNINLNNANNNFSTVSITNGNNVTLRDADAIDIGASIVNGVLTVTASGTITDSGAMVVNGGTNLTAGVTNNITLDDANDFQGPVQINSGNDVVLNDTDGIDLGASTVSGALNVTANGNIVDSGNLDVTGTTTFTTAITSDITLDDNNNFSTVSVVSALNVELNDVNDLDLGTSTMSGTLAVTTNGALTDSGDIIVNGGTNLTAGVANNITLDNANDFQGPVKINSGNDVALNDVDGIDLGVSTVSGVLNITANGNIVDSGNLNVTGTTTLTTAITSDITLNSSNDFSTVSVVSGGDVELNDVNALDLGTSTMSGTLAVTTNGNLTDSGDIIVNGGTNLTAGVVNNITLDNANDFQGPVKVNSGNDVTLNDVDDLEFGTSTVTGNLITSTGGALLDSGDVTANALKFTAGTTVALDQAGNNFGTVAGTSNGEVLITDVNDLTVGTVSGTDGINSNNGNIILNTGANLTLDKDVNAGNGDATLNSSGTIREGASDDAVPVADVIAKNIYLNSPVAAPGDAIGELPSYLDIQVTDSATGSWNASVPNGGNVYINCIGDCPIGQVDLGAGTFYYSGNLTDGNDDVNGEVNGGDWNITAGGVHLDADNAGDGFIGTATDWIEMRLSNYGGTPDTNGRLVASAGTGGIHISNDAPTDPNLGLQIGGVPLVAPMADGLTSTGGIEVYSFSPLVVAANVIDNSANPIDLVAVGNTGVDDLTIQTGVSVNQQGSGAINLFAGDDIQFQGTALVQSNGGIIRAGAGEDRTFNLITDAFEGDGTNAAAIVMSTNGAFRSTGGNIDLTANNQLRISEVNASTGNVTLNADADANGAGRIEDRNGVNALNVTGDEVTMNAGSGIGVNGANVVDAIETNLNRLTLSNTTTGHVAVTEVAAGGQLDIVNATQSSNDTMTIQTLDGNLRVLGAANGGSGVFAQAGELTLAANGGGANDDLIINNTVTTTTGKANLDSTSRDVRFNANGDVTATGGAEIEVNANRDIFMADGTILNANLGGIEGGIDLDAGRNITLGSVQTTSALSVDVNNDVFDAVQIDAGGAVIDGGDSDDDIIANSGQTTINAANGIGSADQLDVQLQTLRATNTTANDIRMREMTAGGDLNVAGVDQQATNGDLRITTQDGSLTVLDVALLLSGFAGGVSAVNGITRLFASDNNGSATDHLNVNNSVNSTDGKINLDSENDVNFNVHGDVTSVTGEIEVDAANDINMSDNLGVDGTVLDAGTGQIDLDAGNDITLTSVQTDNTGDEAVVIVAGGQIRDGGDTDVDIRTGANGGMILAANTGIGSRGTGVNVNPNSAANNFATDALDTQGGRLAEITQTGDIQIQNVGALEITTLTDTDGGTPMGSPGAGTVAGVLNNDAGHLDPASIIFITTSSPMTISSTVINLDGGNISLYAQGALPADTMTINANIQSINGNGDIRLVSGSTMTMGTGVDVSTAGDGITAGTGQIAVGAGYDATGKAADVDISPNPNLDLTAPSLLIQSTTPLNPSLLDTVGDINADLIMNESAQITTEEGNILADAQRTLIVGSMSTDSNADGIRGDITTFSRNGSTLDAEAGVDFGNNNLDFLANRLTMYSGGTIGTQPDPIETDAKFVDTFSIGSQFINNNGNVDVELNSSGGSIFFGNTGDINLGHVNAPAGEVHLNALGNIFSNGGGEVRIIAGNLIELIATGVVGTASNAIHTQLNDTPAQINVFAGGTLNGVSANVTSNIAAAGVNMLNNPPGLVLFNGTQFAGQTLSGLIGDESSLYYKAFVRGLAQYGDIDGTYAADFPAYNNYESLAFSPDLTIDTSALDIPVRDLTLAPKVVPLPRPAQPTPVPERATTGTAPVLGKQEPTPPAVVPIPANAVPSNQSTTDEGIPETPVSN